MISLFLLGSGANLRSGILLWLFKEPENTHKISVRREINIKCHGTCSIQNPNMADQTTVPGLALSAGFGMFYSLYAFHYIQDITWWCEDMNFIFEWQNNILQMSAASE